jgi:hypothetical protein
MGYLISIITSHAIFLMTGYSNLLTDQHKEKYTPNIIDLSWKKENLKTFTWSLDCKNEVKVIS